jgi:hypothetical protein
MARMQDKLQQELQSGSRVVSFVFAFPSWKHERMEEGTYLYRKP